MQSGDGVGVDSILATDLEDLMDKVDRVQPKALPDESTAEDVPLTVSGGPEVLDCYNEPISAEQDGNVTNLGDWVVISSDCASSSDSDNTTISNQEMLDNYLQRKKDIVNSELESESACQMIITLVDDSVTSIKTCNDQGLSDHHWCWRFMPFGNTIYTIGRTGDYVQGTLHGSFMLKNEIGLWIPKVMIDVTIDLYAEVKKVEVIPSVSMSKTTVMIVLEAFPRTYSFPVVSPSWYEFLLLRERLPLTDEATTLIGQGATLLCDTATSVWKRSQLFAIGSTRVASDSMSALESIWPQSTS